TPSPAPSVTLLPVVDFGTVALGEAASSQSFKITFPAGEEATLSTDAPWLRVYPRNVKQRGSRVTVTLDTTRLQPGKLQLGGNWFRRWTGWHTCQLVPVERDTHAHVAIELKGGGQQRLTANVTVVPKPWQVRLGWAMTGGVMLLETAAAGGMVLSLAAAIF
ncbi:MAG: hypothetical protein U9Q70_10370, partial [Chloroflexota bacterium]|nr:hypothetical protein [Chloroflexota bacterium]